MDSSNPDLRISDDDRTHVSRLLEHAVGQGMLTLDEFSERIDLTLVARTRGELAAVVADLPGSDLPQHATSMPATRRAVARVDVQRLAPRAMDSASAAGAEYSDV